MIVHRFSQRTPEWYAARETCVITASELGPFVFKADATSAKARASHIAKKLAEPIYADASLSGYDLLQKMREKEDKAFDYNLPVQRGTALEAEARDIYREITGKIVCEVGFVTTDCKRFGASPDALIVSREMDDEDNDESLAHCAVHGLEMKCPIPETHIKWLTAGVLPEEHKCQVHGSMAITGLRSWDFMSYCPGLPPLMVTVPRDKFTEEMMEGMNRLYAEFCQTGGKIRDLWNQHMREMEGRAA